MIYYGCIKGVHMKKIKENMSSIFTVVILILVAFIMLTGSIKVTMNEQTIRFKGSYWFGKEVQMSEIEEISIEENIDLGKRVLGVGSPKLLVGNFKNNQWGSYSLYGYKQCTTYIVIETKNEIIVVNDETDELTQELYQKINKNIEKRN